MSEIVEKWGQKLCATFSNDRAQYGSVRPYFVYQMAVPFQTRDFRINGVTILHPLTNQLYQINQSINQASNQSIKQSRNLEINQSNNQSIKQAINQSIKQSSSNLEINQSINQASKQASNQEI